ncbi:MAG: restriction endonuclease subunit S, partial [Thermoguttaceae bacterium]|nr:restriction endonuclease subunit S [Thermoguttaceae bacterium]
KAKKEQKTLFDFEQSDVPTEEHPYSIPENWVWKKLTENVSVVTGKKDANYGSVNGQYTFFTCASEPISCDDYSFEGESLIVPGNGANVGQVSYFNGKFEAYQRTYVLQAISPSTLLKYVYYHMLAFWRSYNADKQYGSATNYIKIGNFTGYNIPLPPITEQARIVSLIESLFSRLDQARAKAQEVIDGFELWKSAILHKAFTGRLVKQRPEERTGEELFREIQKEKQRLVKEGKIKKEKALPEIKEDEIPFEIPEGWKWVRLGNIISISSGNGLTSSKMQGGDIPVYGGNGITGYHNESFIHEETVVIGRVGFYCGSVYVTEKEAWITDNAFITSYPKICIERGYLVHILRYMNLGKTNNSTAQPVVSGKTIYPLLFPLPPLSEQKRIVSQIESLFSRMEEAVDKAKTVVEQIDAIKKSILEKAFRGELGTNDPTEESALELLKSAE